MNLTIDELAQSSSYRRRTSHATPAGSHHTGLSPVCTTLFAACLGPCAGLAPGGDAHSRGPHGDRGVAGDGAVDRAPLHDLPSGLEPGGLVSPPRESDSVRGAHHAADPPWRDHRPGGGRYPGTPLGTEDHRERLLSGRRTLVEETRHPLFRPEMGVDAALGARTLEPAGVGVALSHHAVQAGEARGPATPQDQCGLGAADDAAGAPLAARASAGAGRRWRFCRGGAGPGVCEEPRGHGLAPALGCRPVSPSGTAVPGQTRSQTHQGEAPTPLAGLGRAPRYPLGDRGSRLVRGPAQTPLGLLAHRAVVHPPLAPRRHPRRAGRYPEGKLRMDAFFCTDLAATPVEILPWVVMRWSLEVTCEEGHAHLGLETQRQWSDQAIARTTPILLALFSLVTVLALKLSHGGEIPVPVTAWYHKTEPTFVDCLALGRRHLWRVRYVMNSAPEADIIQFPREVLDLLIHGLPATA
jgi:hypothetical protein